MTEVTPAIPRLRRVAPLALVVVLAVACGDNDKGTATPKPAPSATTRSGETLPAPTVATGNGTKSAGKGTLVMGKGNLLPLLGSSIRRFAPTQVEGKSLQVVALAGLEAFWAGRSSSQRILVKMRLKGGDPPKVTVGQEVDFIGLLTASPSDAGILELENDADTALLEREGAYVDASAADVKLR